MAKKFSTLFLLLLMFCSLTLFVGCGKDDEKDKEPGKDNEVVDTGNKTEDNNEKKPVANNDKKEEKEEKKVVLLKRNGVEWKENTSIKSKRGAQKYTVVWGDTLSLIARTWNVNTYKLASYNGIKDIDKIEVGQVVYNYAYKG